MKIEVEVFAVTEKLPETEPLRDILILIDHEFMVTTSGIFEVCGSGITHWCELPKVKDESKS